MIWKCGFDNNPSQVSVTRLRDSALSMPLPTGVLTGHSRSSPSVIERLGNEDRA